MSMQLDLRQAQEGVTVAVSPGVLLKACAKSALRRKHKEPTRDWLGRLTKIKLDHLNLTHFPTVESEQKAYAERVAYRLKQRGYYNRAGNTSSHKPLPPSLRDCKQLRTLYLNDNHLQSLEHMSSWLEPCKNMENVYLQNNQLVTLRGLAPCKTKQGIGAWGKVYATGNQLWRLEGFAPEKVDSKQGSSSNNGLTHEMDGDRYTFPVYARELYIGRQRIPRSATQLPVFTFCPNTLQTLSFSLFVLSLPGLHLRACDIFPALAGLQELRELDVSDNDIGQISESQFFRDQAGQSSDPQQQEGAKQLDTQPQHPSQSFSSRRLDDPVSPEGFHGLLQLLESLPQLCSLDLRDNPCMKVDSFRRRLHKDVLLRCTQLVRFCDKPVARNHKVFLYRSEQRKHEREMKKMPRATARVQAPGEPQTTSTQSQVNDENVPRPTSSGEHFASVKFAKRPVRKPSAKRENTLLRMARKRGMEGRAPPSQSTANTQPPQGGLNVTELSL